MGAGGLGAFQACDSKQHARAVEGGGKYILPPLLQRIPRMVPQDSVSTFKRSHGYGGLSYSRGVARRIATSFSRPTYFFETYLFCALTLRDAQEWLTLLELLDGSLDLSLNELTESTFGNIFPPQVFLVQSSTP
jgi:hypothetical protein